MIQLNLAFYSKLYSRGYTCSKLIKVQCQISLYFDIDISNYKIKIKNLTFFEQDFSLNLVK